MTFEMVSVAIFAFRDLFVVDDKNRSHHKDDREEDTDESSTKEALICALLSKPDYLHRKHSYALFSSLY